MVPNMEQFGIPRPVIATMLALVVAFATGAGVGATPRQDRPTDGVKDEGALRASVSQWWAARQARNHGAMYKLFDPGYRAKTPFETFLKESTVRSRFDVASHEIVKLQPLDQDRATVFLEIGTTFEKFGGPHKIQVQEPWVRIDGAWYKVHEPYKPPFPVKLPNETPGPSVCG